MKWLTLLRPLLACAALAAPVPKEKGGGFQKGWDKPTDPKMFTFTKGSVTIEVPGKEPHDIDWKAPEKSKAPRLLRAVQGDFLLEVRVTGPFRAAGGQGALVAAGLFIDIKGDKDRLLLLEFGHVNPTAFQ